MNVAVVYNPASGSAQPKDVLASYFNDANITVIDWINITEPGVDQKFTALTEKGATIAAIGGDGTIATAVNHISGTKSILAPLPGGTLNHFTKDAGITQDLAQAIKNLPISTPRSVDIAMVNGKIFLNNSSIGIYPVSLETRKHSEDKLGKWPAAIIASVRAFIRFKLYSVTINDKTFQTPFMFIGNNTYHLQRGGVRESLTDGTLCVYAVASNKRRTLFKLIGAAFVYKLRKQPEFIEMHTKAITIHTKRPLVTVSYDGEITKLEAPLHYESRPKALTII